MSPVSANEWDLRESLGFIDQARACLAYDVTVSRAADAADRLERPGSPS